MKAILGTKIGMTQIPDNDGDMKAVTAIQAGPCFVSQIRDPKKDGYQAVQIAYGEKKKLKKPQKKHLEKAKISQNLKKLAEFKTEKEYQLGAEIKADIFQEGDIIEIIGVSKGKGFAGTIKRHGFKQGPKTHGSHNIRQPGSIGSMFPQRVIKGRKMPGHLGAARTTVKNLEILKIYPEKNLILVTGAVPGPNKGIIMIQGKEKLKQKSEVK